MMPLFLFKIIFRLRLKPDANQVHVCEVVVAEGVRIAVFILSKLGQASWNRPWHAAYNLVRFRTVQSFQRD